MDSHEFGQMELWKHECDIHSLTRTRTLKGGWFGLTAAHLDIALQRELG